MCRPQAQVHDGVNNSQVTLHTGQEVKDHLSIEVKYEQVDTNHRHLWKTSVETTAEECEPSDTHQLYDSHVAGKEVGVTQRRARGLFPPSLKTQVEDKTGERKEAEEACHG